MTRQWCVAAGIVVTAVIALSSALRAQIPAQAGAAGPQGQSRSSRIPDLSGDWFHPVVISLSTVDRRGAMRGNEPDIPYQPWARAKTLSEVSTTGPDGKFELNTDPYVRYCEPLGLVRMFGYPGKSRFVQTPEAVYILDEIGPTFRVVWLNGTHPEDPDPQYWGHSIGWYENGDTLVVDTVGVNDRSWFDQLAHVHSDQLHLIERFKRINDQTLGYEITIDDPGAYTKPWGMSRTFSRSTTGFMRYQWVCSLRENDEQFDKLAKPASSVPASAN
ncbi:MAG: hypothetical protein ABL993_02950 [Vicinamibacterales bacterium]